MVVPRIASAAVVAAVLAAGAALVPAAPAQAPARATASARVAGGDLGVSAVVRARGDARERDAARLTGGALAVARGTATATATRDDGAGRAQAAAIARDVSVLDGLVRAAEVRRSAVAEDGQVTYGGEVRGLQIGGEPRVDLPERRSFTADGVRVTVNADGAGLTVELTEAAAGFAAGDRARIAVVRAAAFDGADPAPAPRPSATPAPSVTPAPEPEAEPSPDAAAPRRRRESAARRLARGRFVFPVHGRVRVADDFGGPRAIGPHQGNDLFAPFGAPVLAVADGTLNRVGTLPISGNRLWLQTDRGDAFFYAHMSAFAPDAVNGRRVQAGTLLGFTGNTGNAEPTPPHVHFEIHPGDGAAIDPHAALLAWRARGAAPAGGWLARYGDAAAPQPGALVASRDLIAEG